MINLPLRLKTIADYVLDNSKVIDVGCDHALLDIYLYQTKKNINIIISDKNKEALNAGINNLKKYKLENVITARLGNGLEVIQKDEIDTIVISGMGAHNIVGILLYSKEKLTNVKRMILQANNNVAFLREKIITLGYHIEKEILIKENNIIYTIIVFDKGKKKYRKKELYFGPILLKENSSLFQEYNKKELEKLLLLLDKVPKKKYLYRYKLKRQVKLYQKLEFN